MWNLRKLGQSWEVSGFYYVICRERSKEKALRTFMNEHVSKVLEKMKLSVVWVSYRHEVKWMAMQGLEYGKEFPYRENFSSASTTLNAIFFKNPSLSLEIVKGPRNTFLFTGNEKKMTLPDFHSPSKLVICLSGFCGYSNLNPHFTCMCTCTCISVNKCIQIYMYQAGGQASSAENECNPDVPTLIVYSEIEANLLQYSFQLSALSLHCNIEQWRSVLIDS